MTREADVFAFGMVVIEVRPRASPHLVLEVVITSKIMDGSQLACPKEARELHLTKAVWEMAVRCWRQDPPQRPTMTEVIRLAREWPVFPFSPWNEHHNVLRAATRWLLRGLESRISQSRSSPTTSYPSVKPRMCFPSAAPISSSPSSQLMKHSGNESWRSITISQCRGRPGRVAGSSSTRD